MLTMVDARKALLTVQKRWKSMIPPALLKYKAKQIVVLADDLTFKLHFTKAYEGVFKTATGMTETTGAAIAGAPAFVSPFPDNAKRKIYVSVKGIEKSFTLAQQLMIMSHEYVHWLSHSKFYPDYYKVGGLNPFRVEGITQWATVQCGYLSEHKSAGGYQNEYLKTESYLKNKPTQKAALDFIFKGLPTDLSKLKK
ncbi:MAG: hypothetical protein ACYTKD_23885 [Planctomycetota bacterium]|jgi:hypothetical protein